MRVFTILGPSQSGKTTLARALAGLDGVMGKRQETAAVAAMQPFSFMGENWAAIDLAGGAENLAQAGPALAASDAAVLCVPADPEAAVLAAPYLRQIEEAGIPAFLFVNRIDQANGRVADIIAALQTYSNHNIVLRQVPIREAGQVVGAVDLISERAWKYIEGQPSALIELPVEMQEREQKARVEMLEALADFDDHLLEELIEDQTILAEEAYEIATRVLQHNDLFPALLGAAEHSNGILRLMKSLRHEVPQVDVTRARLAELGDVVAVGCMADQVKHLGKTVLVRALDGGLGNGKPVAGSSLGSLAVVVPGAGNGVISAGDVGQAVKSDHLNLGYCYSAEGSTALPSWARPRPSTYRRLVMPVHERDETRLSAALERLVEIDPAVRIEQDAISGHALLHLQGPLHLRRILATLENEFGVEAVGEMVPPALCETITKTVQIHHRHRKQSGGAGQFADVVVEISPLPRGGGIQFTDTVKGGAVPKNNIPSVEAGARDALSEGRNGHPVVDVAILLKDGKHHSVDSSDFAFRTAGKHAVREALDQAGLVLLQPIMKVSIHVPSVFTGGLVPVVSGMKGQILGFSADEGAAGWDVFETLLPLAAQDELCHSLASATRGTGWFETGFDHYEEARRGDFELA
ncbi:elongation factor G [Phaeobacter sp. 11ANDIMAR09]|uniref:elongation factor G n=1 Tax=Phaeobacter sp. 11ANDIMAR09 TaxID=1225647 RepID=UPI0006C86FF3|nr:elongation factor G [Phaeobacter sp. 11ANDIMAR09]KPD13248.1 elongation factor G [Phaeobacter sp. 11ANDIMAR09]